MHSPSATSKLLVHHSCVSCAPGASRNRNSRATLEPARTSRFRGRRLVLAVTATLSSTIPHGRGHGGVAVRATGSYRFSHRDWPVPQFVDHPRVRACTWVSGGGMRHGASRFSRRFARSEGHRSPRLGLLRTVPSSLDTSGVEMRSTPPSPPSPKVPYHFRVAMSPPPSGPLCKAGRDRSYGFVSSGIDLRAMARSVLYQDVILRISLFDAPSRGSGARG